MKILNTLNVSYYSSGMFIFRLIGGMYADHIGDLRYSALAGARLIYVLSEKWATYFSGRFNKVLHAVFCTSAL